MKRFLWLVLCLGLVRYGYGAAPSVSPYKINSSGDVKPGLNMVFGKVKIGSGTPGFAGGAGTLYVGSAAEFASTVYLTPLAGSGDRLLYVDNTGRAYPVTLGGGLTFSGGTLGVTGGTFESPLTFTSGLTRSVNTITNDLITGKSGGQTIVGGTGSGENLTLTSTSHATKGKILFGASSAYDSVNLRLGIGTASPSFSLTINQGSAAFLGPDNTTVPTISTATQINEIRGFGGLSTSDAGDLILSAGGGTTLNRKMSIILHGEGGTDTSQIRFKAGDTTYFTMDRLGQTTYASVSTFSAAGTGVAVTNNATVGGTLGVTGTTTAAAINASGAYTQTGTGANTFTGKVTLKRVVHNDTAQVAGDWAASGWGASAAVTVTGTDSRGIVIVTTNAADTPSANPTLTLTFKDGTWTTAPFAVSTWESTATGPNAQIGITTTATTMVIKYIGTPTATSALTYKFAFQVQG